MVVAVSAGLKAFGLMCLLHSRTNATAAIFYFSVLCEAAFCAIVGVAVSSMVTARACKHAASGAFLAVACFSLIRGIVVLLQAVRWLTASDSQPPKRSQRLPTATVDSSSPFGVGGERAHVARGGESPQGGSALRQRPTGRVESE